MLSIPSKQSLPTIYFHNVRSLLKDLSFFQMSLIDGFYNIYALTESWLDDSVPSGIITTDYNLFRCDRSGRGGGVLLVCSKVYTVKYSYVSANFEMIIVSFFVNKCLYTIILVYLPPPVSVSDLDNLFLEVNNILFSFNVSSNIILMGDFNVSSYLPNTFSSISPLSDSLYSNVFMLNLDFVDISPSRLSHFLDLIMSDLPLVVSCSTPIFNSDHRSFSFVIPAPDKSDYISPPIYVFNYSLTDLVLLNAAVAAIDWTALVEGLCVDEQFTLFIYTIQQLIYMYTPLYVSYTDRHKKPDYPWVDSELRALLQIKLALHRIFIDSHSPFSYTLFSEARSHYKSQFLRSKQLYFDNLALSIKMGNSAHLWSYLKKIASKSPIPLNLRCGDIELDNDLSIANAFQEYFSSQYHSVSYPLPVIENFALMTIPTPQFTPFEVSQVISALPHDNSVSPDNISPNVIHAITPFILVFFTGLINSLFSFNVFPSILKFSLILPILKCLPSSDVHNYRPISIISNFSKIIERLLLNYLYAHLKPLISPFQHGFIKNRSTLTNLSVYSSCIIDSLNKGYQLDSVYTDFQKAFDKVSHQLLLHKLSSYGIHSNLIDFISSFLSGRSQIVRIRSASSFFASVTSGVVQGSVLGPFLFSLFINDLPSLLPSYSLLFADDLKIFMPIACYSDHLILQHSVDVLVEWSMIWHLPLNLSKCKVITFSRTINYYSFYYTINKLPLVRVSNVTDLGVIYQSNYSFSLHIFSIVKKASKMLGYLKRITSNFNHVSVLNAIYFSYVRSNLEYCSPIWGFCTKQHTALIERIQRNYVNYLCYKLRYDRRSCSYSILCSRFHLTSLESRRIVFELCFFHNVLHSRVDASSLLSLISFTVPTYYSRSFLSFALPFASTNLLKHSPLVRPQHRLNTTDIDPFLEYSVFRQQCIFKFYVESQI